MKLFTAIFLFSWLLISTCGQKKKEIEHFVGVGDWITSVLDDEGNAIELKNDSILFISGDTVKIVKHLLLEHFKLMKENCECQQSLDSAKHTFANTNDLHW